MMALNHQLTNNDCPKGAPSSGQSPGRGVDSYMFKSENLSLTLENKWCHAELGSLMKTPCQVRNSIKHLFQKKE